ncbi:hypothetical protein K1719_002014 [Acacia pycnantha]|nr:hypothetical protein K1719_002014 [Acacia pycnantha]
MPVTSNLPPLLLVFLCLKFFLVNKKGEYKLQAVYLKWGGGAHTSPIASSKISNPTERLNSMESPEGRSELFVVSTEDPESGDDNVIFDLAKFIGRGKVPFKVLKDVGELISHTLGQAQNHQSLSGPRSCLMSWKVHCFDTKEKCTCIIEGTENVSKYSSSISVDNYGKVHFFFFIESDVWY